MSYARYIARELAERILPGAEASLVQAAANRLETDVRAIARECSAEGYEDGLERIAKEFGYCAGCGGSRKRSRMLSAWRGVEVITCPDCKGEE